MAISAPLSGIFGSIILKLGFPASSKDVKGSERLCPILPESHFNSSLCHLKSAGLTSGMGKVRVPKASSALTAP